MANLFNDFDDNNNLFDDSFDFLQQSGDSLFGDVNSSKKKEDKKEVKQETKPESTEKPTKEETKEGNQQVEIEKVEESIEAVQEQQEPEVAQEQTKVSADQEQVEVEEKKSKKGSKKGSKSSKKKSKTEEPVEENNDSIEVEPVNEEIQTEDISEENTNEGPEGDENQDSIQSVEENSEIGLENLDNEAVAEIQESAEPETETTDEVEDEESSDGHYDSKGYYWFNNGTYYDADNLYHDLEGNVYDVDGNLVDTGAIVETEQYLDSEQEDNVQAEQENEEQIEYEQQSEGEEEQIEDEVEQTEEEQSEYEVEEEAETLEEQEEGVEVTVNIEEKNKEKVKKEKKPKERLYDENATFGQKCKAIFLRKKVLIPIILLVFVLIAGAVAGIVIHNNKINAKIDTPNFEIYQRGYGTTLVIDDMERAEKYEVVVTRNGKKTTFTSPSNVIEVASYLNQVGEFKVKVRALGLTDKAHSDYSVEKDLVNYIQLAQPLVFRTEDTLTWNAIPNAIEYRVYYGVDSENDLVQYSTISQGTGIMSFDLDTVHPNGPGLYKIIIEAIAEQGTYYLNSEYSETYIYEYKDALQQPFSAKYNKETNDLTFELIEGVFNPTQFKVVVTYNDGNYSTSEHILYANDLQKETIEGNIKRIKYGANFNDVFTNEVVSMTIKSISTNSYETDSNVTTVTII